MVAYGIDDSIVDAKRIVGRARSGSGWAGVLIAALAGAACSQRVNLGAIGDGSASLLWKATFETGNLSEWSGDGQGGPHLENDRDAGVAAATSAQAHGGSLSGVVGIQPTTGTAVSINYLFRDQPSPAQAYYSAWFYVQSPLVLATGQYLSLVHFRGNGPQGVEGLWDVNLYPVGDGTVAAQLYDYRASDDLQQFPLTRFPLDRWVQLEVFFSKAVDATGRVTVWQDGAQILDRSGVPTVQVMNSLEWDVGGASAGLQSGSALVYLDDAAISVVRLGPDAVL